MTKFTPNEDGTVNLSNIPWHRFITLVDALNHYNEECATTQEDIDFGDTLQKMFDDELPRRYPVPLS